MRRLASLSTLSLALLFPLPSPASAATRVQVNLVPASATDPPTDPTLSPKGSLKFDDKGTVFAVLKGVTDASGAPASSSKSYTSSGLLDGSEYVVILKIGIPAVPGTSGEVPVAVDVKSGNGSAKLSLGGLLAMFPAGLGRSIDFQGAEVWGPLGVANVASCQAVVSALLPLTAPLAPDCRGGTEIGVGGVHIP